MQPIENSFRSEAVDIGSLCTKPGIGFYIPLYQRDYSWDEENVEQLLDDISEGVRVLASDDADADNTIRFLGTMIVVADKDQQGINPKDPKALPTAVWFIIDGQQRLSTIALLACLLDEQITLFADRLPDEQPYGDLKDHVIVMRDTLRVLYAHDLMRGEPRWKPKIIRGQQDTWTLDGPNSNYQSPVASFLAAWISGGLETPPVRPAILRDSVGTNLRLMRKRLEKIADIHIQPPEDDDIEFPTAREILDRVEERYIWAFDRPELVLKLTKADVAQDRVASATSSLVQLFAFCHFLTSRCCITLIKPTTDTWAFDMFQSLNATGTPLTAIETFKPTVVQNENRIDNYEGSGSQRSFSYVDALISTTRSTQNRSRLTNELLNSHALTWEGKKLSNHFSEQRRWLNDCYTRPALDINKQRIFVQSLGDISNYFNKIWFGADRLPGDVLPFFRGHPEAEIATLCLLVLRDGKHRITNAILSRFYRQAIDNPTLEKDELIKAIKAVTAFFVLWRSTRSNSGLDNAHRNVMRGYENSSGSIFPGMSITGMERVTVADLKIRLTDLLFTDKHLNRKAKPWVARMAKELTTDTASATIVKFCLLQSFHDTTPDSSSPGLMKVARPGSHPHLNPTQWESSDLREIEHIAPQTPKKNSGWDQDLYVDNKFEYIGNLTLLPKSINSSASNKGWQEKCLYYQHVGEEDMARLESLSDQAKGKGIKLANETINLLQNCQFSRHVQPLINVGIDGAWNLDLVGRRSERISEIVFDRMNIWLL